ncbi:MAG: hypothetical protein LBR99_01130 [Treponema sp.]|jgi:hypothetical protein|nr:hypothetical protein [Treponema sp.]
MALGSKPTVDYAGEMGMSVDAYMEVQALGKVPIPYDSDDMVCEANRIPSNFLFHARDTVDPDIWYRQKISKRMRNGKDFYENSDRNGDFKGFDPNDRTAIYKNP